MTKTTALPSNILSRADVAFVSYAADIRYLPGPPTLADVMQAEFWRNYATVLRCNDLIRVITVDADRMFNVAAVTAMGAILEPWPKGGPA